MGIKEKAEEILNEHGCEFVTMLSECCVVWKNPKGVIRHDDIFVLQNMTESAWEFFEKL